MHSCSCGNGGLHNKLAEINNKISKLERLVFETQPPVNLQCKFLHPMAKLPAKSGDDEIGWDISCVDDDSFFTVVEGNMISEQEKWIGIGRLHSISYYSGQCDYTDVKVGDKIFTLPPNTSHLFHTGFACAIQRGFAVLFRDRSGMGAKKNIHCLAGAIDCTYRGEWLVSLINLSKVPHYIKAGDKIVQGIITKVIDGKASIVDELPKSYRDEAGFGSTGR